MTALHITGGNSIQSNNEGEIDCGNGKRADSCGNCKQSGVNAEQWCGGDCEYNNPNTVRLSSLHKSAVLCTLILILTLLF